MEVTRRALCGLGFALALIATPAVAGWETFGLNANRGSGHSSQPQIELPDITEPDIASPLYEEPPVPGNDPFPTNLVIETNTPSDDGPQTAQVPEPATLSLLALGLLGLGLNPRRRNKA